jgi:predicted permease
VNLPVWLDNRIADLRYGIRMIIKTPGLSSIAMISLALGIGANTAIFSLVDTLLLKRLPVKSPQELFMPSTDQRVSWNYPDYIAFREHNRSFSGLAAYGSGVRALGMQLNSTDTTEIAYVHMVSGSYFDVLGVTPALGRLFTEEEDRKPGSSPYVVLSYQYWLNRFGGTEDVIGRSLRLNGHVFTIIGITRSGFRGTDVTTAPQLFIPLLMYSEISGEPYSRWNSRHYWWMHLVGRIKPGVSKSQAETELSGILRSQVEAERKAEPNSRTGKPSPVILRPAGTGYSSVRNRLEKPLIVLMAVVGLVLLIACANVANLMLARGTARQHEMAIRLAVGATRAKLTGQLLIESILIALLGGAAGLVLARFGVDVLLTFVPPSGETQVVLRVMPDLRLLGFTFTVSLLTGIVFGIAPALRCTKPDLIPVLKDEVPGSTGPSRLTLRNALVVVQVALSLLLLIGAGLFVRSLGNLRSVETGFRHDQTVIVSVNPNRNGYKGQRLREFFERLRARITALPGISSVSLAAITPLSGMRWNNDFTVEGYQWKPDEEKTVDINAVGPRYFETIGLPLMLGRDFRDEDNPAVTPEPPESFMAERKQPEPPGPRVAIVTESIARRFFSGRNPIGSHICFGEEYDSSRAYEIIGVVKDARYFGLREKSEPMAYLPIWRQNPFATSICIRTNRDMASLVADVRRLVTDLDPAVPVMNSRTMQQQIDNDILTDRLIATLSGFFGFLALLLAAVGLYGVISYAVTRRTREIGIRMALGAPRSVVLRLVVRDAALLILAGAAIGIPSALAATRLVKSFLFGIDAQDPVTILGGTAVLAAAAALACFVPARRATRVDPMSSLRYE